MRVTPDHILDAGKFGGDEAEAQPVAEDGKEEVHDSEDDENLYEWEENEPSLIRGIKPALLLSISTKFSSFSTKMSTFSTKISSFSIKICHPSRFLFHRLFFCTGGGAPHN